MSGTMEVVVETLQLGADAAYHYLDSTRSKEFHKQSIALEKHQHQKDIKLIKQTYLMDVFLNLEQHFQQLNAGNVLFS